MKESKEEVEKSILILAESLDIKDSISETIKLDGLHTTAKNVIFRAFTLGKNDYFETDDKVFEAYQIIRTYCSEMLKNGHVVFNKKYGT